SVVSFPVLFPCSVPRRDLHSFPTRRSSDLDGTFALMSPVMTSTEGRWVATTRWMPVARASCARRQIACSTSGPCSIIRSASSSRSEEHTSELQSLAYLVCRLLLEKKKQKTH